MSELNDLLTLLHWNWTWLNILGLSLFLTFSIKLLLKFVSSRLRKMTKLTPARYDDIVLDLMDGLKRPVLFVWLFYFFSQFVAVSARGNRWLLVACVVTAIFQFGQWGLYIIRNCRDQYLGKRTQGDPSGAAAMGLLFIGLQALFLVTLFLIGLSNLGIDIGAMLAGLGVGGIAVALAAQNILGDLLASLSIVLDKPFVIGDFISSGEEMGTVEQIGLKTTRIRSLSGEKIIFPNKNLLESRVRNYRYLTERRAVQNFRVVYGTSVEQLEMIPVWVKEIIERHPVLKFDRCHFAKYGASSLDFELVFYVNHPDYNLFMDHQQKVLLSIMRRLQEEKIAFALPTQNVAVLEPRLSS